MGHKIVKKETKMIRKNKKILIKVKLIIKII
ncbi:hypothetical protein SDC9_03498 [bioreactor metagenome]|uniref:Uncharacterized protein n=1 Tax=bioreactor metagenome TaxID=1076179 RepID=A0A644STN3_9ZZZZ